MNNQFPDFIWDIKTGQLFDTKSRSFFRDHGDSGDINAQFQNINSVRQFLDEYNITGKVGQKLYTD